MLSSFYITAPHLATVPTFCLMANTTFSKTQETAGRVSFISMQWSFTLSFCVFMRWGEENIFIKVMHQSI